MDQFCCGGRLDPSLQFGVGHSVCNCWVGFQEKVLRNHDQRNSRCIAELEDEKEVSMTDLH